MLVLYFGIIINQKNLYTMSKKLKKTEKRWIQMEIKKINL